MRPLRDSLSNALWAAVPFAVLMAAYWATAAPGPWWGDGMELTCAAKVLGIPHPTGYPLYILLGHLMIRVFAFMDPARVMAMFSAVCCAAGAVLVGAGAREWIRFSRGAEPASGMPARAVCAGLALITGFSRTLWEHATFAEVYPLTFLIVAATVWLAARDLNRGPESGRDRIWIPLAILWGLAMLHHYSALAILPLAVLAVAFRAGRFSPRRLVLFAIASAIFLLGYLFIHVRAGMNPALNWGDPSEFNRFISHITGGDYAALNQLRRQSAGSVIFSSVFWLAWWGRQLLPESNPGFDYAPTAVSILLGTALVAGAVAGCAVIFRRAAAFGAGLLLSIAATLGFSIIYLIPDRDGYFLPAVPAVLLGWLALAQATANLKAGGGGIRWSRIGAAAVFALAGAMVLTQWRQVDKHTDRGPEIWAGAVLDALPQNALIITSQGNDSEIYALWYAQMAGGRRTDVTVFGGGFIFKGWYQKYFSHPSRPSLPLFITERPPTDKRTFDAAFAAGVILPNLDARGVFMTSPEAAGLVQVTPMTGVEGLEGDYARYLTKEGTAYPFFLPSRVLLRATMNEQSREAARREFASIFGQDPSIH